MVKYKKVGEVMFLDMFTIFVMPLVILAVIVGGVFGIVILWGKYGEEPDNRNRSVYKEITVQNEE